jgi:putative transposase
MKREKAFKFRFYPTPEQEAQLAQTFGCARYVYNWGLETRTKAYAQEQKNLKYPDTCKKLTALKKEPERLFLGEVSAAVLQQSLRNLESSFSNFFAKRGKYPKFKNKHDRQSVRYTNNAFTLHEGVLTLAKQDEPLNISWSRELPKDSELVSCTVSKDRSARYFVSILVKTEIKPLKKLKTEVGIDVGLKTLAVVSDGQILENPKFLQKKMRKLKRIQRRVSRKVKGSSNRNRAKLKLAKIHAQVVDARNDYLHKFTTKIISENQAIFVESLNVKGMQQNHALAGSIASAAWGEMFRQFEYKAQWAGRTYHEIDRWYPSSKTCSHCGHLLSELSLAVREWDCPGCLTRHERDFNASCNILAAGKFEIKTTLSDAGKVTPTRYERRLSA